MEPRSSAGWQQGIAARVAYLSPAVAGAGPAPGRRPLLLFVIIATLSSHRYWEFAEAVPRRAQDNNFYKNLAMMGGLVFAFVTAGGRFSVDRLLARK